MTFDDDRQLYVIQAIVDGKLMDIQFTEISQTQMDALRRTPSQHTTFPKPNIYSCLIVQNHTVRNTLSTWWSISTLAIQEKGCSWDVRAEKLKTKNSSAPENRMQTAAVSVSYFGHHNTMIQRRKISGLGTSVSSILSGSKKRQPIIAFLNYNVLKLFHELVKRLKAHQEKESRAERRSQLMQKQMQSQFHHV
ncbi:Oidioi.mRNA.OKI2018_I69.XSR.g15643.t1.cds [Oikopleura dioica]|uniref:Oidioi.mRNA.OKI2018_I69.XSR.g15643.t1.cds n=1 Tax=Oikopleura dioica TaxID=34765 RepID=A0ABN7SIM4_OIKDI|nr:Oidioi.mRNA.OKI2018_I69.XSR.g15643.t1.cds [Oikopleura dioica]